MALKTVEDFVTAYHHADYRWEELDKPLIRFFAENPRHEDVKIVFGKITLVNRTYNTNLHMAGDEAEWRLARHFVSTSVDKIISPFQAVKRFGRHMLSDLMAVHSDLVSSANEVTHRNENSFCSKYLSFHFPETVPIFDQYAYVTSRRLIGSSLMRGMYLGQKNADYGYHCQAVATLVEALETSGVKDWRIKLIDNILYADRDHSV